MAEVEGSAETVAAHPSWVWRLARVAIAPLEAAAFLTVVPVPMPRSLAGSSMGWAFACFPLVGAALGWLLGLLDGLIGLWLPAQVSAALLLAALLALTGALHLDALMDSFDGLFGGKDPAGRLAIMRDSRVGSFGIAAAGSVLLIEYGCLLSLPAGGRAPALIVAAGLSRWGMAVALAAFPAASARGLAAGLKGQVRWPHAAVATGLAAALALAVLGWAGLGIAAAAALLVGFGGRVATARLGGINGDICGGLGQLVEAAVLVGAVAVVGNHG